VDRSHERYRQGGSNEFGGLKLDWFMPDGGKNTVVLTVNEAGA
jgi:hypothetical protein